jgi:hypothetical protein
MTMPPIEAALPFAAQDFADGRIDVESRTDGRLGSIQLIAAGFFIRPLPRHSAHFGG